MDKDMMVGSAGKCDAISWNISMGSDPIDFAIKFVRPSLRLRSIVLHFAIIALALMAINDSAHANGEIFPQSFIYLSSNQSNVIYADQNSACLGEAQYLSASGSFESVEYCFLAPLSVNSYRSLLLRFYMTSQGQPHVRRGTFEAAIAKVTCPAHSSPSASSNITCTCNPNFKPDPTATSCVPDATCKIPGLTPLEPLDPAVQPYEDGLIDMDNLTQATRDGAACIVRVARAGRLRPRITSGYRPPAYQTHIRAVYDNWQLLENNNDAACADTKRKVKIEFDHHGPFAHQPGRTSRHPARRAVDISLLNYSNADTIAAGCTMSRTVSNDRVHFESPR